MEKRNVTIRLDMNVLKWLEQQAQLELRPVANYIVRLIVEDYRQHQKGISSKGDSSLV